MEGEGFEFPGGDFEEFEALGAALDGEGLEAVALAEAVGDDIAEVNAGGELLVRFAGTGVVMAADGGDEDFREIPAIR